MLYIHERINEKAGGSRNAFHRFKTEFRSGSHSINLMAEDGTVSS
jgi:hypothetical protein